MEKNTKKLDQNSESLVYKAFEYIKGVKIFDFYRSKNNQSRDVDRYSSTKNNRKFSLSGKPTVENDVFMSLKNSIFEQIDLLRMQKRERQQAAPDYFRESGKINEGRRYFYIKPQGEIGWLFERSGNGWVISRSEKILGQNTFLRSQDVFDIVTVYRSEDSDQLMRVHSQRMGGELMSYIVYKQKLLKNLNLI